MRDLVKVQYRESGTPRVFWIVSALFIVVGLAFAILVPSVVASSAPGQPEGEASIAMMLLVFRILGFTFLALGSLILILLLVSLYIRKKHPEKLDIWYWWINFIGGVLGALVFALPSTCALPFLYGAYLRRPNYFFAGDAPFEARFMILGATFSLLGILVAVATYFIARSHYKSRP